MTAFFKFLIISILIMAVGTSISLLIPQQVSDNINISIVYYLNFINYLKPILPVDTIFTVIKLISAFIFALATFFTLKWLLDLFSR